MNTEGKAKAYNKVREKIALRFGSNVAEEIFSEFEETDDERIRKDIIAFIKKRDRSDCDYDYDKWIAWLEKQKEYESTDFEYVWDRTDCGDLTSALDKYSEEAIINMCHAWYDKGIELERKSWVEKQGYTKKDVDDAYLKGICNTKHELEKQGEQESADKHEPKFHVGEWIVWQNKCYKVNDNGCGYELIDQNGLSTSLEYGTVDTSARLWDITKDAKDGDVLISQYNKPFIYNGNHNSFHIGSYCGISTENRFNVATEKCRWTENINIHPSTKKQRDTLFAKMKEKGYEWSEETHGLNKISQRMVSAEAKEALYDKPAWSEEDMKEALRTEYEKGRADGIAEMKKHIDIIDKDNIDDFAYQCAYDLSKDWLYENASWDDVQIACKLGAKWYEEHHKVRWSDEDETNLTNTIIMLKEGASLHFTNSSITPCVDWLKQLKQRIGG